MNSPKVRTSPDDSIVWVDERGVVHLRNSERTTMLKCPQRWWWAWREGLRPKETPKALWFGSAIHEALALYYRPGTKRTSTTKTLDAFRDYADMEAEYIRAHVGSIDEEKWIDARTLGETMLTGYIEHYGGDRDWDVIATEQTFELRIPFASKHDAEHPQVVLWKRMLELGMGWDPSWNTDYFILNGTFDGVYRDKRDKRVKLMEHKTAASITTGHLSMDPQAGTYWAVAQSVGRSQGWLGPKENIRQITYNFLRKAIPDDRPRNERGMATNLPTKEHYIAALDEYVEWPTTRNGDIKYPTVAAMKERAEGLGLVVLGDVSKSQPPPLFERYGVIKTPAMRRTQVARLQQEARNMSLVVARTLPVLKSPGRDTCPMCPFKEMCELHENEGDWEGYRDAMYRAEDQYAEHRRNVKSA